MKNLLTIFVLITALAACKFADKKTSGKEMSESEKSKVLKDSSNYTSIAWLDSTYVDYGDLKEGNILEVAFHFKNTGDHNLIITEVRPGCGCTDPQKPEEPIAPGKEDVIKAKFNSQGQHIGENRKYLYVTANTKPSQTTELTFRVNVTK